MEPTLRPRPTPTLEPSLSRRAYSQLDWACAWTEVWESGNYTQRVSELLETARDSAVFVGWQVDSRLPLPAPGRPGVTETLKDKVLRLCSQKPGLSIHFLMWDHAYFYMLERERFQGRTWDQIHPRVHFVFDNRHPFGACHHEKIVLIDGRVALVGGVDLASDRWDSPLHPYRDRRRNHGPYHDLAVEVSGPIVGRLNRHVAERWRGLSTLPFPEEPVAAPFDPATSHPVYLSRTLVPVDCGDRESKIHREIEWLFRDLVRAARSRIVLEGQYYWSPRFNELLIQQIRAQQARPRPRPFEVRLILANLDLLPLPTQLMGGLQNRLLGQLLRAGEETGALVHVGYPEVLPPRQGAEPKPIYVHSKILLIDDHFLSIGSANFADRAFRVDTEVMLTLEARSPLQRQHLRRFGDQVLRHWGLPGQQQSIRLRTARPRQDLAQLTRRLPLATRPFWKALYDPRQPWLQPWIRRLRRATRTRPWVGKLALLTLLLLDAGTAMALAGAGQGRGWAAVFSTAWLLPVPVTLACVWTGYQLGGLRAARTATAGLWVAALTGYTLARWVPSVVERLFRKSGLESLPPRIRHRNFPDLVRLLLDPATSVRSKIIDQGLGSVPFPWFVLGTLGVLPGALQLLCRVSALLGGKN